MAGTRVTAASSHTSPAAVRPHATPLGCGDIRGRGVGPRLTGGAMSMRLEHERGCLVLSRRQPLIPIAAITAAVLGAPAIMLGPITPWMRGVEMCGVVSFVGGSAVLVLWLLTRWWGSPRHRRSAGRHYRRS
jgi:hypothetical protein